MTHETADVINGAFEAAGAVFLWLDVLAIMKHKRVQGIFWPARAVYTAWGVWNVLYYPTLGQPRSFFAGLAVLAANAVWFGLFLRYRRLAP